MPQLRLYFLRHGQTQFNVYGRLQGWSNSQLTEQGILVAKEAGKEFANINFEAVYSSDLGRAVETCQIFLAENYFTTPNINVSKNLREVSFGYYEGLEGAKVWALAEEEARKNYGYSENDSLSEEIKLNMLKKLDPAKLAESYDDFTKRLLNEIEVIVNRHNEGNILIVSHSSAIKAIFKSLIFTYELKEEPANGSMSVLSYEDNKYNLLAYNSFRISDFIAIN